MSKSVTRLSTKGQLILPKSIRLARRWSAGTQLVVRDTPEGVLLTAADTAHSVDMDEIFGCLNYAGPARTVAEMDSGVLAEAGRQHARD